MIGAIIHGDDFGLAPAVNDGIVAAHERGCLASASLSVPGPCAEDAAERASALPRLGIGLHLTLVGERPVCEPHEIPSLVMKDGRFPSSAMTFAPRWLCGAIRPDEVRREIQAQFAKADRLGLRLTHVDAHDHVHVLPGLFEIVVEEMQRVGLHRVRIPREQATIDHDSWKRRGQRVALNTLARRSANIARREGLIFPDRFLGFLGAGHINSDSLIARLESLQAGVTEISLHPAAGSELPRGDFADWQYDWEGELNALLDPAVQAVIERRGIRTMHYGELAERSESSVGGAGDLGAARCAALRSAR